MGEEEFVDTIMDIDALLMQIQSDMQTNNNPRALIRLRQAREIISEMHDPEDDISALNAMK